MSITFIYYFIIGMVISFLGTVPFGPINLSVIDTSFEKGFRAGFIMAIAAAIIEIFQSSTAFFFGRILTKYIEDSIVFRLVVIAVLIGFGLYFLLKSYKKRTTKKRKSWFKKELSPLSKGFLVAILNPQAMPYWTIAFAMLESIEIIETTLSPACSVALIIGISLGKLACLTSYAALSVMMAERVQGINVLLNRIMALILFVVGLFQGIKLFWEENV